MPKKLSRKYLEMAETASVIKNSDIGLSVDVVISGGGLAGQSLALALADLGFKILVLERGRVEPTLLPEYDGRALALSYGPLRFLQTIQVVNEFGTNSEFKKSKKNLWQLLAPQAEPIWDIRIADGDVLKGISSLSAHFSAKSLKQSLNQDLFNTRLLPEHEIDPFGVIVENRFLRHVLSSSIRRSPNIKLLENSQIAKSEETQNNLIITLQTVEEKYKHVICQLLVIAEGRHSNLARQITSFLEKDYAQTALVLTVATERHHHGVAVELFYPSGPFAMLPMQTTDRHNRMNVVWIEKTTSAEQLLRLPIQDFFDQLQQRFGDWLGPLELITKPESYPLSARHAKNYGKNRQILVADAAHHIHPIAGQGFNLGLKDIAALVSILKIAKQQQQDLGATDIIVQYERARFSDNQRMFMLTDGLNKLFDNNHDLVRLARRLGLFIFDQLDIIKKPTVRYAMGVMGGVMDKKLSDSFSNTAPKDF